MIQHHAVAHPLDALEVTGTRASDNARPCRHELMRHRTVRLGYMGNIIGLPMKGRDHVVDLRAKNGAHHSRKQWLLAISLDSAALYPATLESEGVRILASITMLSRPRLYSVSLKKAIHAAPSAILLLSNR